ncbi:hypothetical protein L6452_33690 [Arctium lappa]|uniref:Uncharacterized protein n=1 Tax=Arctium lappa TaxID=4217 RepID=A0ACB8YGT4_ARCLA|nr:hypothetical protein L6452_33690 [Arctium lappa]
MFAGKVPPALRSFRNLRFFNISGNSFLQDPLPALTQLDSLAPELKTMKTNHKNVPKRYIFAESTISSGNQTENFQAPASSPAPVPNKEHKKKSTMWRWIIGLFGGLLAGFLIIFTVFYKLVFIMVNGGVNDAGPAIFSQSIKAEELAFLDDDDGVAALQVIGRGGCGEVYRTDIPDGKIKTIAIKKMRQIPSEIQTDGQIRHRNLLPLLAHVFRPTFGVLLGVLVMGKLPSDKFFQHIGNEFGEMDEKGDDFRRSKTSDRSQSFWKGVRGANASRSQGRVFLYTR